MLSASLFFHSVWDNSFDLVFAHLEEYCSGVLGGKVHFFSKSFFFLSLLLLFREVEGYGVRSVSFLPKKIGLIFREQNNFYDKKPYLYRKK